MPFRLRAHLANLWSAIDPLRPQRERKIVDNWESFEDAMRRDYAEAGNVSSSPALHRVIDWYADQNGIDREQIRNVIRVRNKVVYGSPVATSNELREASQKLRQMYLDAK